MGNSYTYSDNSRYINESFPNFREIVINDTTNQFFNIPGPSGTWSDYTVYSWDLSEKIEEVNQTVSQLHFLQIKKI